MNDTPRMNNDEQLLILDWWQHDLSSSTNSVQARPTISINFNKGKSPASFLFKSWMGAQQNQWRVNKECVDERPGWSLASKLQSFSTSGQPLESDRNFRGRGVTLECVVPTLGPDNTPSKSNAIIHGRKNLHPEPFKPQPPNVQSPASTASNGFQRPKCPRR